MKVRKEVARERREELDLETGRLRSWVETREYEVLDLTGNFTVSSLALAHLPSRPISSGDTEEAPADSQQFPARQHSGYGSHRPQHSGYGSHGRHHSGCGSHR